MQLQRLDHLVLTVADIDRTVTFYTEVLGMEKVVFGEQRVALKFGQQKINLHESGKEFEPKARTPQPGSADLCFITATNINEVVDHLRVCGVPLLEGPIHRTGAMGPIVSVYIRDPDDNLIEISNY